MNSLGRRISLQGLLASSIVLCLLAMLAVVVVQGYRGAEAAMLAAANDSARQLGSTLNERAGRLINPAESAIRLLAHDPIAAATDLETRLQRIPVLVETLNANATLSAVYIGYANGEFVLVRRLDNPEFKARIEAPEMSDYLVQTISLDEQGLTQGNWLFYDLAFRLHDRREMPDYRFDPRTRPWYQQAEASGSLVLTRPYVFFTTGEVGLTMAMYSLTGDAVIGMDASVSDLAGEVEDMRLTPGTEMAVVGHDLEVIAYPELERVIRSDTQGPRLASLSELNIPALNRLAAFDRAMTSPQAFEVNGAAWYGLSLPLASFNQADARILIAIPAWELLSGARRILINQALWALALMGVLILAGWALGHRLGQPLKTLADQVKALADFDFSRPPGVRSQIREVDNLSQVIGNMAKAIDNFQAISLNLSSEPRLDRMLDTLLVNLVDIAGAEAGAVYLGSEDETRLQRAAAFKGEHYPDSFEQDAALRQQPALELARRLDREQYDLTLVLHDRKGELLGVVALQMPGATAPQHSLRRFMQELSGVLAVAIETRQLFEGQQRLLEAIIKLLADAIDAKSPYTGGHCERVPQLAEMLVDKAVAMERGPFADFSLDDEQRYAFRIAAWLHDCGKITSPEYVVDKATKLETLYNRIHEVRTRFEVLWRDAELDYWKALASGESQEQLAEQLAARQRQLQEDFALLAEANIGGEFMSDQALAEVQRIAGQTWLRHFDNRIGLSFEERERLARVPPQSLPALEPLLADRPEHLVHWGERKPPVQRDDPRNSWGFDMRLPEHAYNLGELHNLSIRRGTLTDEERFKINEHIVQTLIMLSTLPFPKALREVPDIAANHHEKLDGQGYPRRLDASRLDVPARIMAIADIFEALTAADRPYKPAKTLSESLAIMTRMAAERHIDAELYALFLQSGVYREYAEGFLQPGQIDAVDVEAVLAPLREQGVLD